MILYALFVLIADSVKEDAIKTSPGLSCFLEANGDTDTYRQGYKSSLIFNHILNYSSPLGETFL